MLDVIIWGLILNIRRYKTTSQNSRLKHSKKFFWDQITVEKT